MAFDRSASIILLRERSRLFLAMGMRIVRGATEALLGIEIGVPETEVRELSVAIAQNSRKARAMVQEGLR